jgi:hypothetical protein
VKDNKEDWVKSGDEVKGLEGANGEDRE